MRSKKEAITIAKELKQLKVIDGYSFQRYFNKPSCINCQINTNIRVDLVQVLKGIVENVMNVFVEVDKVFPRLIIEYEDLEEQKWNKKLISQVYNIFEVQERMKK